MSDVQEQESGWQGLVAMLVFWGVILAASYFVANAVECLASSIDRIIAPELKDFLDHQSIIHRFLVSGVATLVLLGGLLLYGWLVRKADGLLLDAVLVIAGVMLAVVFPLDLCQVF